jgi:hypothetical protein
MYLMHDWYIFGAWLMHSLMVQVEVQVGAWLMHLFMVQVDYRLFGTGCYRFLVQVDWYKFTVVYLTVIV